MITWLLLLVSVALAARLELDVDVRELSVGQTVSASLQVVNGRVRGVPDLPASAGLRVQYQMQSSSTQVVNLRSTSIQRFTYSVTAVSEGAQQVGPVEMDVDGEHLVAAPVTVMVHPRSAEAMAKSSVSGTLSDTEPYLGEVVVYTFRYQHKDRVLDARWTAPDYDGFIAEKNADAAQREWTVQQDGEDWSVQEVTVPLVAVGAGQRVIAPAVLTTQVPVETRRRNRDPWRDSFFGRMTDVRTETLGTDPVQVRIRPLPDEGRPADFSGLVGHFELAARPDARRVALGESITLDVVLTGTGTLAGYHLPGLADDAGFRVYDDEPEVVAAVQDGRFVSRARFRRAVVPEGEGRLVLPAIEIPVFDPDAGAYTVLKSDPVAIEVLPGEGAGEVASFATGERDRRESVEALGDDILPVPGQVRVRDRTLRAALPLAVGLPMLPALGLLGLWVGQVLKRRQRDPWDELRRRLDALPTEPAARLALLELLFREAAGLRLQRPAPGLDRAAVAGLGDDAAALYDAIASARYGGAAVGDIEARVRAFVLGGAR